jgi:hypothetical protein
MGDLVPAAAPLGIRLEEVGAAIATLTLQGVPAAEAATRVKNSMIQLAKPSKELSALLKANGYDSGEAAVKAVGYAGVLQLLDKATHGSVTATAALTPEIRGLLGVVGLTGRNLATYEANLIAMNQAQEGAGRTAQVFAEQQKSGAFQLQRLSANAESLKIQLAAGLGPSINHLADQLSDWLENDQNIERVQRDVNSVVRTGGHAVSELAGFLEHLSDVAEPVVDALGGIEKAAEIALIVGLVYKARRAALSFGGIGRSSAVAATEVVASAQRMEAALDLATRPRNVVVTTTYVPGTGPTPTTAPGPRNSYPTLPGGGVPPAAAAAGAAGAAAAGKITRIFRGKGGATLVERISPYGSRVITPLASLLPAAPSGALGFLGGFAVYGVGSAGAGVEQREPLALLEENGKWFLYYGNKQRIEISAKQAAKYKADHTQAQTYAGPTGKGATFGITRLTPNKKRGGGGTGGGGGGGFVFDADLAKTATGRRLQLALLKAENTPALQDDVAANKAISNFYERGLSTVRKAAPAYNTIFAQYSQYHRAELAALEQINAEKQRQRDEKHSLMVADHQAELAALRATEARFKASLADAKTPAGVRRADDKLIAFYKRAAKDLKLTDVERARYAAAVKRTEASEEKLIGKSYRVVLGVREQRLINARDRAGLTDQLDDDKKTTAALAAFYKQEAADKRLRVLERLAYQKKLTAVQKKTTNNDVGKPATVEQIESAVKDATRTMLDIQRRYAPNYQLKTATLETHGYNQVAELRRQTEAIDRLVARTSFPASGYAIASAEAAAS